MSGRGVVPARLSDRATGVLLVLPAMTLFAAVVCYPLVAALSTSLFRQSLVLPGRQFVGLDNFRLVLGGRFWPLLGQTAVFATAATVLPFILGFALALALDTRRRGRHPLPDAVRGVLRSVLLLPWVIPGVVASFLWMWIFNANYGLLNGVLTRAGVLDAPVSWLGGPGTAMAAVVVARSWASFPWIMVMLLAGLRTVPTHLHEAAALDGAGALAGFHHVTLPHLRGIIGTVLLLELIWNVQHFDMIYVLTGGGPAGTTTTFAVAVYNSAFKAFDLGAAGALGALWMLLLSVLVLVYVRVSEQGTPR